MNRSIKKSLSVLLAMFLLFVSCLSVSVNAETDTETSADTTLDYGEDGKMDLDVVFVLDASNSMLSSDPHRVAVDAFNLFTDLCDETCGIGYTVYTEKLKASNPIVSLDNKTNLEKLKKNISSIKYDPNGSTDIALGLTKAMNIHSQNKNTDSNRKKAIILLSDGNTYLENGPRTLAEANKEMNSTLKTLNSRNIPVYSIGLNYDGTLDKKELQKISKATNGKSYETTTSDKLITIISDIFSDIYKSNGTDCEIKDGKTQINIKDSSTSQVNIIIKSNLSLDELNPVLISSDGERIPLKDNDDVIVTSTGSYILIKLSYPAKGVWDLHLDNATPDNCTVTQLNVYSLFVRQNVVSSAKVGETVKIESSLCDSEGIVKDYDLFETLEMTAVVTNSKGSQTITLKRKSGNVYAGEFTADTEGEYTVKTTANAQAFQKESFTAKVIIKSQSEDTSSVISKNPNNNNNDLHLNPIAIYVSSNLFLLIGIGILVVVVIIVAIIVIQAIIRSKMDDSKIKNATQNTNQPVKKAPVSEAEKPLQPAPKPQDPEYVDVHLVEHDALENLVKKGPDDAFNKNADNYKADTNLESLIKKGAENPFNTKASDYKADENLEKLIKKGSDDPFNTKLDEYKTDENLEKLIRKGADDPFNTKLDEYKSDPNLEKLIKSGESGLKDTTDDNE